MDTYEARYISDGEVTVIRFTMERPLNAERNTPETVIAHGAGLLFLHDCCPGEVFCVYRIVEGEEPWAVNIVRPHYYYRDDPDLWPST